jgi:transposase-like protein
MSLNPIQFQRGLSLPEFMSRFGAEEQCEQALAQARWPQGWRCARCNCSRFGRTQNRLGRPLWECFLCGYQSSSIVGTIFENTKLPLAKWFLAMHLLTQSKNGVSALELSRHLGVSYKSAWSMKHKLLSVMALREQGRKLDATVQIDDAYLGGEREGHMHGGRGAFGKSAFVAAVQTDALGRPQVMRLDPIREFTNEDLRQWALKALAPSAHVVSDGTACFRRVTEMGATHERHVTGGGRASVQLPQFKWVNTMLGNLKTAITGTYHSINHAKYATRYLAEFCYRFNRRHDLSAMPARLLRAATLTKPLPQKHLRLSETWC